MGVIDTEDYDPHQDLELLAALLNIKEAHALIDALVDLRNRKGYSQKDLSKLMGVSQSTISGFESESNDPRISTVQRYARAIGVKVSFKIENRLLPQTSPLGNWGAEAWDSDNQRGEKTPTWNASRVG